MNGSRWLLLALTGALVLGIAGWWLGMPHAAGADADAPALASPTIPADGGGAALPSTPAPAASSISGSSTDGMVSPSWLNRTAAATGIPVRALQAYAAAAIRSQARSPRCQLGWNTLAAIGEVESAHGTLGGASIGADGRLVGTIFGPRLDGHGYDAVPDTDHGRLDADPEFDRAVGPMQFLPATWATHGVDGSGDGVADPDQIDDAALTTAEYLCLGGADLSTTAGWQAAIEAYNHSDAYVESVRAWATRYADGAAG